MKKKESFTKNQAYIFRDSPKRDCPVSHCPVLYVVATPIGNIGDISKRAIETIKNVNVVIAENSHKFKKLCSLLNIDHSNKQIITYGDFSNDNNLQGILLLISKSKKTLLVTEAGTPLISDPGYKIIEKLRKENLDVNIAAIPGPSAVVAHLSISGLPTDKFMFLGFLPKTKSKRLNVLKNLNQINKIIKTTFVIYESKYKIKNTLQDIQSLYPTSTVSVANELTKMHEKVYFGTPEEVLKNITTPKGEFVVHLKLNDN